MTIGTEDHAMLADDAYNTHRIGQEVILGNVHYKVLDEVHNKLNGYQGTAYVRVDTGDIVIAHCGTDAPRMKYQDIATDAGMVTAGVNAQTPDAMAFTKKALEEGKRFDEQNYLSFHATVTGHSLGGTLAEITAYRCGLHGETYNAYGAAGLFQGIPEGGNQVINYVRATDVVSAASKHFGETHIYASQQDIDRLQKAGYRDNAGPLNLGNPIKGTDFDAHSATNFLPNNPRLGHSIISKENEALYESHKGMIDHYRQDVLVTRSVVSLPWEERKAVVEVGMATGHFVDEKAIQGVHATEQAAQYVGHEAHQGYDYAKEKAIQAAHATEHGAQYVGHEAHQGYDYAKEKAIQAAHATEHGAQYVGHEVHQGYDYAKEKTIQAAHATEHGAQYVGHEAVKGYNATVDATSRGIEATAHAGHQAYDATSRGMEDVTNFAKAHPIQLNHPSHPDNKLFQQVHDGVKKIDAQHGRASDHHSENLAGALTVEAKAQGLKRIDTVALSDDGSKAFAAQNVIPGAFKNVAGVETAQAVHIPIEQSTQQMTQVNQALPQHAQTQQQVQSQQQAAPVNPQQSSPTMTR